MAPPTAKALPTAAATTSELAERWARTATAAHAISSAMPAANGISGANRPTAEPASRPMAGMAATARTPASGANFTDRFITKDTKDTKVLKPKDFSFVSLVSFVVDQSVSEAQKLRRASTRCSAAIPA